MPGWIRFELENPYMKRPGDSHTILDPVGLRKFIQDVRAGLSDEEIVKKYKLAPQALVRQISASEFAADVRNGMSDHDLMRKYEVSPRGLWKGFTKLLDANLIETSHIQGRLKQFESPIVVEGTRNYPRVNLDIHIPLYDVCGEITDISEKGFRVSGIQIVAEEIRSFVIPFDNFFASGQISLRARCVWSNERDEAGFEIIEISNEDLKELRRIIHTLYFEDDAAVF
jgi:hypothetical protein